MSPLSAALSPIASGATRAQSTSISLLSSSRAGEGGGNGSGSGSGTERDSGTERERVRDKTGYGSGSGTGGDGMRKSVLRNRTESVTASVVASTASSIPAQGVIIPPPPPIPPPQPPGSSSPTVGPLVVTSEPRPRRSSGSRVGHVPGAYPLVLANGRGSQDPGTSRVASHSVHELGEGGRRNSAMHFPPSPSDGAGGQAPSPMNITMSMLPRTVKEP